MNRWILSLLVVWLALGAASCRSTGDDGGDNAEISAIDVADVASFNKHLAPLSDGSGYEDPCVGCIAYWAEIEDPNKLSNNPQYNWLELQRKCHEKNQCKLFDYANAWSPAVFIYKLTQGPHARWSNWRKEGKKVVCLYDHPYYAGKELCYEGPGLARLSDSLAGKVSSYRGINVERFYATGGGLKKYQGFGSMEGFNLTPEYNDKINEVIIVNQ
jgi:hypothetical protein